MILINTKHAYKKTNNLAQLYIFIGPQHNTYIW